MAGPWNLTSRPAASSAAGVSQAAPTNGLATGLSVRLRQLSASLDGIAAGSDLLVVRDGAAGSGTIIWQADLNVVISTSQFITINGLDLRATPGNALTVEFVSGSNSNRECINASGDMVPVGWPMFQS